MTAIVPHAALKLRRWRGWPCWLLRFALPTAKRSNRWQWRALLPCLIKRAAKPTNNQATHQSGFTKTHFGFGGVNVDIHFAQRNLKEQRDNRMAIPGKHIGICAAHSSGQQAIFNRTTIDEQILMISHAAIESWQASNTRKPEALTLKIKPNARLCECTVGKRCHSVWAAFTRCDH